MAFVRIPGLAGKLYVPEQKPASPKKHDCEDCFSCQNCGDDRCQACRLKRPRACSSSPPEKDALLKRNCPQRNPR